MNAKALQGGLKLQCGGPQLIVIHATAAAGWTAEKLQRWKPIRNFPDSGLIQV